MDPFNDNCIKLFAFSLPLFCLLSWSWAASSAAAPFLPPSSSALLAADVLRVRGYSLFASVIVSLPAAAANFSGTLLAPPDFAFSFATAQFFNNRRPPPRPSVSVLLYHTLKPPLVLTWPALSSRDDGDELRTLYNNNCLYLFKSTYGGEISISSSPFNNPISAVKIRQPDLYVDEHLAVHGIDGVLDPSFAAKCSDIPYVDPTVEIFPRPANRTFLDHAIRALRRTGYNVVAAAMGIRRAELLSLMSVTVFAVSDKSLFLKTGGFRYDFRHHVVPIRYRFADLADSMAGGMELETLDPKKTVLVQSVDGAVSIDGVAVDVTEVYRNRWVVVVSVTASLDDVVDFQGNPPITGAVPFPGNSAPSQAPISGNSAPSPAPISGNLAPSPAPFSSVSANGNLPRFPSPAPETENGVPFPAPETENGVPSSAPETENGVPSSVPANSPYSSTDFSSVNTSSSPSPPPEIESPQNSVSSPTPTPAPTTDDVSNSHCDLNAVVSGGVEGGDLFCPVSNVRQLGEKEILTVVQVEESKPLDSYNPVSENLTQLDEVKIAENVNIADDVFFYI